MIEPTELTIVPAAAATNDDSLGSTAPSLAAPAPKPRVEQMWFTVADAADRVGMSKEFVKQHVQLGHLVAYRPYGLTKGRFIRRDDLDAFMRGSPPVHVTLVGTEPKVKPQGPAAKRVGALQRGRRKTREPAYSVA